MRPVFVQMREEITQKEQYCLEKFRGRLKGEVIEVAEGKHFGDERGESHQILKLDMSAEVCLCERTHKKSQVVSGGEADPPFFTQLQNHLQLIQFLVKTYVFQL